MLNSQKIIPSSPYPPRILPVLTYCQYSTFVNFGDEGMIILIRTYETNTIGVIGLPCVYVYISSLTPYLYKKKKERESILLILLFFFFGLFWGWSSSNHPRILPVGAMNNHIPLIINIISMGRILPK